MQSRELFVTVIAAFVMSALPGVAQDVPPTQYSVPQNASQAAPATVSGGSVSNADVAPGPLEEARKMLWSRIKQAKSEGIGTGAYVTAFQGIEDQVKAGRQAEEIRPRIESLARSLKDQLDRSRILKTQRPIPPTASQSAGGGGAPSGGKGGGLEALADKLGGKDPSALIDRIKEKLNTGDIPDGLKEKLLNSDKGKKLLEKLSQ